MKSKDANKNLFFTLVGILMVLALLLLTGTTPVDSNSTAQIGRYRLTAVVRGSFPDLFVIDTATGVVKWIGNDEGKPFEQIKGR
jgi:hypothetical protein